MKRQTHRLISILGLCGLVLTLTGCNSNNKTPNSETKITEKLPKSNLPDTNITKTAKQARTILTNVQKSPLTSFKMADVTSVGIGEKITRSQTLINLNNNDYQASITDQSGITMNGYRVAGYSYTQTRPGTAVYAKRKASNKTDQTPTKARDNVRQAVQSYLALNIINHAQVDHNQNGYTVTIEDTPAVRKILTQNFYNTINHHVQITTAYLKVTADNQGKPLSVREKVGFRETSASTVKSGNQTLKGKKFEAINLSVDDIGKKQTIEVPKGKIINAHVKQTK